jgi:predicted PurR-regulated permease PerM
MFQFIERLRRRSPHERRVIALGTAGAISGVIFVVWVVSFVALLNRTDNTIESSQTANLNAFVDSFGEVTKSVQESVGTVREQVENLNSSLEAFGEAAQGIQEPSTAENNVFIDAEALDATSTTSKSF